METSETQLNAQSETTDLDDFGLIDYESPSVDPQIADNYSDDEMVPKEPSSPNTVPDALAASTTQSTTEHNEQGDGLIDYDESVPLEADGVQVEADTDAEVAEAETKIVETTLEDPDAHATEADAKDVAVTVEVLETNMDMPHMDLDTAEYPTAHSVDSSASKNVADTSVPPETWVFSDGEWMVYLGPEQHAFGAEHQRYLFDISLADLINELQTDCALSEDVELALEFPSLALTIDKRDQESDQLSLSMLYSCHAAAILMGKLPVDFVNSSYFSQSAAKVQPSLSAFLFVIHTRPKLQSALQRIMSIKEQAEQENEVVVEQPDSIEQPADVEQGDEEEAADSNANEEEAQANGDDANGPVEEDQEGDEQQTTTAALLADETEEDDEDEDEDFVADEEDENDHVMDADALDEAEEVDNSDVEIEEVESGNQTRVDSENASPSNKRTKAQQISGNSAQSDDTEQEVIQVEEDEPAAKKSKSDSSVDQQPQPSVAA